MSRCPFLALFFGGKTGQVQIQRFHPPRRRARAPVCTNRNGTACFLAGLKGNQQQQTNNDPFSHTVNIHPVPSP